MSVTKQIKEQERQARANGKGIPQDNSGFPLWITLSLTEQEKQYLVEQRAEWLDLETALEQLLLKGCTVKLSENAERGYIEISLREKRLNWKEEKQISFNAKTLMTAVIGLHYAINRHTPGWPTRNTDTVEF